MRFLLIASSLALLLTGWLHAQVSSAPLSAGLRPYASCEPAEGPAITDSSRLPADDHTRTIVTLLGAKQISVTDGVRIAFAFPNTDEFANVKTEVLPLARYAQEKGDLLLEFNRVLASNDDNGRNYNLKPTINGFEIYGMDRSKMEGGVLGYYLLFDRAAHTVTSIYFDDQEPGKRRFSSIGEYAELRDRFLNSYTSCVRGKLAPAASHPPPARRKKARR